MIGRTNAGGAGIKFKIVGSTAQPGGVEGLIWVKTDTPVSSWAVSQAQPKEPAPGMVWVKDGEKNGINIIRRNTIEVFPSSCMQYIGDAWKNMEAYLFRNGEWVQFSYVRIYLIRDGKIVDGVTFVNTGKKFSDQVYYITDVTIQETATGVKFSISSGFGNPSASCRTPEYDFSSLTKIRYSVYSAYGNGSESYKLLGLGDPVYTVNLSPKVTLYAGNDQTMDVSSVTGVQSITLGFHSMNTNVIFTDLWLE